VRQIGSTLAPGPLQFDLSIEPPIRHELAKPDEIAGPAGMSGELVEEIQGVDPSALRPVE
jgi:hypothetical protein